MYLCMYYWKLGGPRGVTYFMRGGPKMCDKVWQRGGESKLVQNSVMYSMDGPLVLPPKDSKNFILRIPYRSLHSHYTTEWSSQFPASTFYVLLAASLYSSDSQQLQCCDPLMTFQKLPRPPAIELIWSLQRNLYLVGCSPSPYFL